MANEIVYGFAETPFGTIIVARTIDGICDLQFLGWNRMEVIHELARHWERTPRRPKTTAWPTR